MRYRRIMSPNISNNHRTKPTHSRRRDPLLIFHRRNDIRLHIHTNLLRNTNNRINPNRILIRLHITIRSNIRILNTWRTIHNNPNILRNTNANRSLHLLPQRNFLSMRPPCFSINLAETTNPMTVPKYSSCLCQRKLYLF